MKFYAIVTVIALCFAPLLRPAAAQPVRPAEKATLGVPVHFTLEADESKDIAIALPKGDYILQADLQLVEKKSTNVQMKVDLLKSNGVLVESRVLVANVIHRSARVAEALRLPKPLGARLRVTNNHKPMEFWLTVIPAGKRTFMPFAFASDQIRPVTVGTDNGVGGTITKNGEDGFYVFHKATLPAGKYDVSLYLKQTQGDKSNLQSGIILLDTFGVPTQDKWALNVNEIDKETRKDKRLVLVKPATVYFRITNKSTFKVYDYTIGIEKATD